MHDQDLEVRKRIKKLMQAMNKHVFNGWLEVLQRRKKSAQCFRDKQVGAAAAKGRIFVVPYFYALARLGRG